MNETEAGEPEVEEVPPKPKPLHLLILAALQRKPVFYYGTVPEHVKAKRRARNKRARASRKVNR